MKMMRRFLTLSLFTALASTGIYLVSCSSDSSDSTEHGGNSDVVYVGDTTDEALDAMLDGTPKNWAWKAGVFDNPTDGAKLPASPIPTFAWHQDSSGPADSGTDAWLLPRARRRSPITFGGLIGPERAAFAHGAPYNGTAFFLVFSTAENPKLLRVFTAGTTYTPDDAAWAKLTAAKSAIKLEISSAIFENNLLTSDGGPFNGSSITFEIQE